MVSSRLREARPTSLQAPALTQALSLGGRRRCILAAWQTTQATSKTDASTSPISDEVIVTGALAAPTEDRHGPTSEEHAEFLQRQHAKTKGYCKLCVHVRPGCNWRHRRKRTCALLLCRLAPARKDSADIVIVLPRRSSQDTVVSGRAVGCFVSANGCVCCKS